MLVEFLVELLPFQGVTVEWVFFANDRASANHNCLNDPSRTDGQGRAKLKDQWTQGYTIPKGCTPQPIVRIPAKSNALSSSS